MINNQKGFAHLLLLISALGVLAFLIASNTFSFKDTLFGYLFKQSTSFAASPLDNPINVGVLVLKYFPLDSTGTRLDLNETGMNTDLASIRTYVNKINQEGIVGMTEGSRFRGNRNTATQPYLKYYVVDDKEYLKPIPPLGPTPTQPDYRTVLNEANICDYVDNRGVSQVWLWSYHTGKIAPVESNMSMGTDSKAFWGNPNYGDVSNSYRIDDMPVCRKTYTLYNYNFGRGLGELLEDHGHQIEALFSWVDGAMWDNFVRPHGLTDGSINSCGWTHSPPNVTNDEQYNWFSQRIVKSDCEDWRPEGGGQVKDVSCSTWSSTSDCPNDGGAKFKVWWMQQIPGWNNNIPYKTATLRNWWELYGDLDMALASGKYLVNPVTLSQDLAENNVTNWGCSAPGFTCFLNLDTTKVKVGSSSIKFTTTSGFDTYTRFPVNGDANWNLTNKTFLSFWAFAENDTPFQDLWVRLKDSNGNYIQYSAPGLMSSALNAWYQFNIPLAGGEGWTKTVSGNPSLADIDQIEIMNDTWDYNFTIYYDGLAFGPDSSVSVTPAPATPAPTPTALPVVCDLNASRLNQFVGCLYDGTNFNILSAEAPEGVVLTTPMDSAIALDINFDTNLPYPAVGTDTFSVKWKGDFKFKAGKYNFKAGSDDGMRVKIDGVLKYDAWGDRGYVEEMFTHTFSQDTTATIEIEYYENTLSARASFGWAYVPTVSPTPIPLPTIMPTPGVNIDTTAPTVTITRPLNGAPINRNSQQIIAASASDNIAVTKVQFYVDNQLINTDTTSPYSYTWKVPGKPNTKYVITAKAYDAANNSKTNSINVSTGR